MEHTNLRQKMWNSFILGKNATLTRTCSIFKKEDLQFMEWVDSGNLIWEKLSYIFASKSGFEIPSFEHYWNYEIP